LGNQVDHKKLGIDKVVELDKNDGYITVKFEIGEKRFQFPQTFEKGFLKV